MSLRSASGMWRHGSSITAKKYGRTEVDAALRGRANAIRMSVIYYPEINVYQGMESVQLIIRNYK